MTPFLSDSVGITESYLGGRSTSRHCTGWKEVTSRIRFHPTGPKGYVSGHVVIEVIWSVGQCYIPLWTGGSSLIRNVLGMHWAQFQPCYYKPNHSRQVRRLTGPSTWPLFVLYEWDRTENILYSVVYFFFFKLKSRFSWFSLISGQTSLWCESDFFPSKRKKERKASVKTIFNGFKL